MSETDEKEPMDPDGAFAESRDFYFENGLMVLTRHFLLARGYCCESGCRHCPYGYIDADNSE